MWCHHCDSDVAAEVGPGGQRARCATCGTEIAALGTPVQATRTREALQLLDRWSRPHLLDPFQTTPGQERELDDPEVTAPPAEISRTEDDGSAEIGESELANPNDDHHSAEPDVHADAGESADVDDAAAESPESDSRKEADGSSSTERGFEWAGSEIGIDSETTDPHESDEHDAVETLIPQQSRLAVATIGATTKDEPTSDAARSHTEFPMNDDSTARTHGTVRDAIAADESVNWVALAGQLLAYGGVAVLTIGTTLALWAHFANEPSHVPTGWLVAAAGQMLLFLGVVTLVSTGIEQTAVDLQRRFDRVADRLDRVESGLDAARTGPRTTRVAQPSRNDVGERIAA